MTLGILVCLLGMPAGHAWAQSSSEDEPIQTITAPTGIDPARAALGHTLFNDPMLSANGVQSCASCHQADHGGSINSSISLPGANGEADTINVPTFLGSALNFSQFWDGRAATLEDQIDGPVTHANEMGTTWAELVRKLNATPHYVATFKTVYGRAPDQAGVKDALAIFERSQTPINSPFDKYLRGDKTAISDEARQGYTIFKTLGCSSCHQGQNVGGNMYQKFGIVGDYFKDRGHITEKDYGRYNVTGLEEDRYVFKVPSLRNVIATPPYFHDGSADTIEKAIAVMAKYQLGRKITPEETAKIKEFLKSLQGELPPPPAVRPHD